MAELIALREPIRASSTTPRPATALAAHLAGELFKAEAKVDIIHVPYKGAAPALQDVIAGHVQMMFATAASVVPHIQERQGARAGGDAAQAHGGVPRDSHHRRARPEGLRRHHLARAGGAGEDAARGRRARCNRATGRRRSRIPRCRKSLGDLGVDIVGDTPEEFAAYIKAEIPEMDRDREGVGREAGLTPSVVMPANAGIHVISARRR